MRISPDGIPQSFWECRADSLTLQTLSVPRNDAEGERERSFLAVDVHSEAADFGEGIEHIQFAFFFEAFLVGVRHQAISQAA